MAPRVINDFVALVCAHPVISGAIVVLFTPPFFPIVKYFSPLLISTALFMLALFTMGPKQATDDDDAAAADTDSALRRDGDGEKVSKRMKPDGSWKDWVKSIEESSLSWMSSPRSNSKLLKPNENWKHMNDGNVSILQDATWVTTGPDYPESLHASGSFMTPSELFKVDSDLQSAAERAIYNNIDLGEDAPELEDVVEPVVHEPVANPSAVAHEPLENPVAEPVAHQPVVHQPLEALEIPRRAVTEIDSPATDVDDDESPAIDNSKRLMFANVKKSSLNASSGLSDTDTPVAVTLSLSGKLKQMENLGDFLDDAEKTDQEAALLKPTTAEDVDDVKDQLQSFVSEVNHGAPAKPVEKPGSEASKEIVSPVPTSDHATMEISNPAADPEKMELDESKKSEISE